jgi:hypothetical protein
LKVEIVEYARVTWTREFSLSFHDTIVQNTGVEAADATDGTTVLVNSDGLIITKETLSEGVDSAGHDFTHYRFEFKGHNLDKMDNFGLSDPYLVLSRPGANRNVLQIHKTEIVKVNLNPTWARCAFFDRNLHSRMPLVPTPARLQRAVQRAGVCPMAFHSGVHSSYRFTL